MRLAAKLMASCRPTPIIGASTSRYVTVETPTVSATAAAKSARNRSQPGAEPEVKSPEYVAQSAPAYQCPFWRFQA